MRLKFKALETPKESAQFETNHFGWATIEVIQFNYDGKGTLLVLNDGELEEMSLKDFRDMLYGGWYQDVTNYSNLIAVD